MVNAIGSLLFTYSKTLRTLKLSALKTIQLLTSKSYQHDYIQVYSLIQNILSSFYIILYYIFTRKNFKHA